MVRKSAEKEGTEERESETSFWQRAVDLLLSKGEKLSDALLGANLLLQHRRQEHQESFPTAPETFADSDEPPASQPSRRISGTNDDPLGAQDPAPGHQRSG
jgi:hypothetical protein